MGVFNFKQGEAIYKYELRNKIGGGEFGEVWLAIDRSIGTQVAIKLLDGKNVSVDERLIEAQIGNHLNHQNLIKVHYADVVDYNGIPLVIISMDYQNQGSIVGKLNSRNFLPLPQLLSSSIDILRGLEYLHEQNMFHNDIKPSNILLGPHNEAILTDYGITCYSADKQPVEPRSFYRLHVAPETLIQNQVSVLSDIYQTGLTIFRLLNGIGLVRNRLTQVGNWDAYNDLVKSGQIVLPQDYQPFVPRNLKAIINKAIDPDPTKRCSSALDLRRSLEKLSYSGFWTADSTGKYIGEDSRYFYTFEEIANGHQKSIFYAYKESKETRRITRITKFCGKNLSDRDLNSTKIAYMQSVVTGNSG